MLETDCTCTGTGEASRGRSTTQRSAAARKVASGDVICEECGETNKPGSEFCMFCGAYLGWQAQQDPAKANEVTQPLPPQSAPPTQSAPRQSQPMQSHPESAPRQNQPAAAPNQAQSAARYQSQPATSAAAPPRETAAARPQQVATPAPTTPAPTTQPEAAHGQPLTTTLATAPVAPIPATCPTCGRPVQEGRRFCGHCGHQLIGPGSNAAGVASVRQAAKRDTWWSRLWNSKDRAARRSYRRSLPPLYRWRRVIIAVLGLGLLAGILTLVGRSPKTFVMARYYDLRNTLVVVQPVTPAIIPAEASAEDTQPGALVDQTAAAWLMNWSDTTQGSPCGVAPTTPVIELSFTRTRIRQIDLRAGLLANNPSRLQQFRPQSIWIAYADQCVPISLADVERQPVPLDTKIAVTSLRIGVQTAYQPAQPAGAQQVLGFTEITLLARPTG